MFKIISRPEPDKIPDLPLPIHVRSTGCNEAPPGWSEDEASSGKNFVQLFWTVQGEGEFILPGERKIRLGAGCAVYRLPGERHRHRSVDPRVPWHYYWFTFDGPGAREFMLAYGYPQRALHAGECPVRLFSELEILLRKRTFHAQRHAVAVAAEILALAGECATAPEHDLAGRFLELAEARFSDPGTRIGDLAAELGCHRTTLTRALRRQVSVSPRRYLGELRLQKALSLLTETNLPIKSIAFAVGIGKTDRFCAMVKNSTGFTPAQYRRHAVRDSR